MSATRRVLLLVGSTKRAHSNSESLGGYLVERLAEVGFAGETMRLYRCLASDEGRAALLAAVRDAEVVVLATPLFWDSLSAPVIRALDLVASDRRTTVPPAGQRFVAILNSGFPEARQSQTALDICRQFCREAGFSWAGGLALGGGEMIAGRPLSGLGAQFRGVTRALDLTATALTESQVVPAEAVELMARPLAPPGLFRVVGDLSWRWQAWKLGTLWRLGARPYVE